MGWATPPTWKPLDRSDLGAGNLLSSEIARVEERRGRPFPCLRHGSGLLIASDYGGEHKGAGWATYAALATTVEAAGLWSSWTRTLRGRLLPDGRSLQFKRLSDRIRRRALPHFLQAADQLPGVLFCIAIPRSVSSIFDGAPHKTRLADLGFPELRPAVEEKILRVTHLVALIVAGLSGQGQDVYWFSDEDALAIHSGARLWPLTRLFATVTSNLLDHDLRHLRVGTSRCDNGSMSIRDLISLADLAAGAISRLLSEVLDLREAPPKGLILPMLRAVPQSRDLVSRWFADDSSELRKVLLLIDEPKANPGLSVTPMKFWLP